MRIHDWGCAALPSLAQLTALFWAAILVAQKRHPYKLPPTAPPAINRIRIRSVWLPAEAAAMGGYAAANLLLTARDRHV